MNDLPLSRARMSRFVAAFASLLASCAAADRSSTVTPSAAVDTTRTVSPEHIAVRVGGTSAVLPRGITSFGAAHARGSAYVLGGYFGTPHAYSEAGQTGDLMRLDLETNEWTRLGEVDKAQSVALVAHEGRLIRVGGMQAHNKEGTPADLHSVDTVEVFDIETSTWSQWPALPEPRSSHDAFVLDDAIWVVGGWSLQGEEHTWHSTIARLDLRHPLDGWTEIDAPFQRRALAVAAVDQKLVMMGGIDTNRELSSEVNIYDTASGTWSTGPEFPGPGFGMAAAALGGAVYASGMDGVLRRWQPGQEAWTDAATLAYPRFFHRLVPTESGTLLAMGGIRDMASGTRVASVEELAIEPTQGETTWLSYTLPSPMQSKNRQGVGLLGDSLFFFGGNKSLGQHDFGPEFFVAEGHALDLVSLAWRPIAPYPEHRQTMSVFATDWGQLVSVGGFGHDGEVARTHPEIYAYHPKKDEWRAIGTLPGQGRTQFGLALREKEAVVFGGLDYDPRRAKDDQFRHQTSLLHAPLTPASMDFESTTTEQPTPRRAFAGALLADRYYMVGGMREDFALVDSCEAYNFADTSWTTISCPKHTRLSGKMVAMGGKLYLAAGSSKTTPEGELRPDHSLEVYDPETNRWEVLVESLPIEPKHLSMLPYGDRLVLTSTHNADGVVNLLIVDPPT